MTKSVVLLSGGLDSTTTLAIALHDNNKVTALSFIYGQKHQREIESAKNICKYYDIDHVIISIDLSSFYSALIKDDISIPKDRKGKLELQIPTTYVPARNIIFLSTAVGLCESINADKIYIGANTVDYSGYPDCRPKFFDAYRNAIKYGTKSGVEGHPVEIVTPIIQSSKADIIRMGKRLGVPFGLTWSCYSGNNIACGHCDSCRLRLKGFREAGLHDEIEYQYNENM